MSLGFQIVALAPPPPEVLWLGVIPISITLGRWVGDILDLAIGPFAGWAEWAKLCSVGGGLFGIAFYITLVVIA